MSVLIAEGVPGRSDVRVVLRIRPGSMRRGDLAIVYPHGVAVTVEVSPRLVRLIMALVLAYRSSPKAPSGECEALFGEESYRGQIDPARLGRLYAKVLRPGPCIESKTVRTYVSELRKLVRVRVEAAARKDPLVRDPDVIAGGDGYRIGPSGIEILGYPDEGSVVRYE